MKDVKKDIEVYKPCSMLGWCPYGPLVEDFPLKEKLDDISCSVYGHDCPAFTMAEPFVDDEHKNLNLTDEKYKELVESISYYIKNDNKPCR